MAPTTTIPQPQQPNSQPPAKYNRGNPLVPMTTKIAADERVLLEEQAAREGRSASALAREAIQRYVRQARNGVTSAT